MPACDNSNIGLVIQCERDELLVDISEIKFMEPLYVLSYSPRYDVLSVVENDKFMPQALKCLFCILGDSDEMGIMIAGKENSHFLDSCVRPGLRW